LTSARIVTPVACGSPIARTTSSRIAITVGGPAMTRNHILTVLRWFSRAGRPINELDLFQAAYFWKYHVAEARCMMCFTEYIRHGTVPGFVVDFIRQFVTNPNRDRSIFGVKS